MLFTAVVIAWVASEMVLGVMRYAGFLGLGLAFRNWLSLAVLMIAGLAALAYRIRVEERALVDHFGEHYRDSRGARSGSFLACIDQYRASSATYES